MEGSIAAALKQFITSCRQPAVMVIPAARRTPHELKHLSDIDDQEAVRFHVAYMFIFRCNEATGIKDDPAPVIRDAISKALIHYYPLAGRLTELEGGKLAVDCNGEGVLFVEADANVHLKELGDVLIPPIPCLNELIFELHGSSTIVNLPLLLFQVTRLMCGGFILTVRANHMIADGVGLLQFLGAVAQLSRGAPTPEVAPVWQRHLLRARDPPQPPRFPHHEYDVVPETDVPPNDLVLRTFLFGRRDIDVLRGLLPPHLQSSTPTFDLLSACLWKCRTAALSPEADQEMRILSTVNARGCKARVGMPRGYYVNAFVMPAAISTAGELCGNPVSYAVELIGKAKAEVDMEYLRSVADLMALRGGPSPSKVGRTFVVSDVTMASRADLDFGWGSPVYAGPADVGGSVPWMSSFFLAFKDANGEDGIGVPIWLPRPAMDKFVEEMGEMLLSPSMVAVSGQQPKSAL